MAASHNKSSALTAEVILQNKRGLHMRCAGLLCETIAPFQADVTISKGRHRASAKSILELLSLSAAPGSKLKISAEGTDAQQALDAAVNFFHSIQEEP